MEVEEEYDDDDELIDILNNIYNSIYKHDIDKIINNIDILIRKNKIKNNYLNSLLNPETYKYSKIPSLMPIPTCSFHMHNYTDIDTNSGKIAIIFNPFFLYRQDFTTDINGDWQNKLMYNNGEGYNWYELQDRANFATKAYEGYYRPVFLSTLLVSTSSTLNEDPSSCVWTPVNIGQDIPDIYTQYRLVSCCVTLKYLGPRETVSGTMGGTTINLNSKRINGFIYFSQYYITTTSSQFTTLSQYNVVDDDYIIEYGNFKIAMNSYYFKETKGDEIKLIYYPIDNSYEEFIRPMGPDDIYNYKNDSIGFNNVILEAKNNYRNGFNFFIYLTDGSDEYPYRFDVYCNFEAIPNPTYLNILPINTNVDKITSKEKKEIINLLKNNSVNEIYKDNLSMENEDWKKKLKKIKKKKINKIKKDINENIEKNNK